MRTATGIVHHETVELPDGSMAVDFVVQGGTRRVALRWDPVRGRAEVRMPSAQALRQARRFLSHQAQWLMRARRRRPAGALFPALVPDAVIPVLDRPTRLKVVAGRAKGGLVDGDTGPELHVPLPQGADFRARTIRVLSALALAQLAPAVARHAAALDVQVGRITVRDVTSLWGSCSRAGNLSFCWRLVLAPPWIVDYLAAHEVAHRREMNHSPAFWAHVERLAPRTREARAWLRRHGGYLMQAGRSAIEGEGTP
jgi:predicted metal-dependent hydrolase